MLVDAASPLSGLGLGHALMLINLRIGCWGRDVFYFEALGCPVAGGRLGSSRGEKVRTEHPAWAGMSTLSTAQAGTAP